jgi:hypothetical protein
MQHKILGLLGVLWLASTMATTGCKAAELSRAQAEIQPRRQGGQRGHWKWWSRARRSRWRKHAYDSERRQAHRLAYVCGGPPALQRRLRLFREGNLMDIEYWQMSDGTKVPIAVETGGMWKDKSQCLRNRDKTKNMPTGSKPQTTYAIFHAKYLNNNCCYNYGNTGNAVHYTGPGTLSALNFSKIEFCSKGTGSGPWVMVDWEQGVYAGNTAKCSSGAAPSADCTNTGENANPSVTFDVVTTLFKHDGVKHWALKAGNAKTGALSVSIDLPSLPKGYSPLKQEGGLGLGEGGAGDTNGTGGFSEGAVIAGETNDATDDAIQKSIVSVYGK